jgi:hypothetical protein
MSLLHVSTIRARIISVNTGTPHGDDLDPASAALAALAAAHRSLSAVIDREHIASRLPDADLGKLTQALRTIASPSPSQASQRPGQTP